MLVHEKSGHYVKLSGTAIIDNITASNSLFEAVFLYNRKLHFLLYKKPPAEKYNETYYFFKSNFLLRSSDIFAIVPGSKILFSPAIVSAS